VTALDGPGQGTNPTKPETLHRAEDVAELWHVSRTKIFELIRTGQLRSLRIGGSRRISESAMAEYISRQSEVAGS